MASVPLGRAAKADWLMMGNAITDIIDEIEFVENIVVVVLDLG